MTLYVYRCKGRCQCQNKPTSQNDSDLPSISCEIRLGKEKSTFVNFFYREWTSGVSGQSDPLSQDDRLCRQINHWKSLHTKNNDVLILGDAN